MDNEVHVVDDNPLRPRHFEARRTPSGAVVIPNARPVKDNAKWTAALKFVADQLPLDRARKDSTDDNTGNDEGKAG